MIGAYRLASNTHQSNHAPVSAAEMYALDISECGRPPNYFSTHALEWYCLTLQYSGVSTEVLGDCTGFATCEPFGDCVPTNNSSAVW